MYADSPVHDGFFKFTLECDTSQPIGGPQDMLFNFNNLDEIIEYKLACICS